MATPQDIILVTGGTGFIGARLIFQLLQKGHTVRTTIRSLTKEASLRSALTEAGASPSNLTVFAADLTSDAGWAEAINGCTYIHHVASPFPATNPKSEDDLIVPAKEGTLRVLRLARDAQVKRVIVTSSFAAIGYGHQPRTESNPFTEEDWSVLDNLAIPVPAYQKSKTIAERAAWDFISSEGEGLELAVVNPVAVFGPLIGKDVGTSNSIVKRMIDGSVPGCPQLYFGAVDVRDVAALHILCMDSPAAVGERFLAVNDDPNVSMLDVAKTVKKGRPELAKKAPTMQLPNFVVKLIGLFDPGVKLIVAELGKRMPASNGKAKKVLGWQPVNTETSLLDTVDSLVAQGIL
ncbi:nucleoside-diphosphate-sugar epimerase [Aulographum hederae CBS 113979]|uniref:Nucleoside-diphosphate-sugar epimerase n=1 Tax=Aulographum hederae CBS 113979 TaxID=1176131 RepID=A0A6G1GTU4_9PEZI|nr:nucleoside-diphosphate-sugar epimerase [Aulographum hederae CBS 113979]